VLGKLAIKPRGIGANWEKGWCKLSPDLPWRRACQLSVKFPNAERKPIPVITIFIAQKEMPKKTG
jgi:hypothetical protein